MNRKFIRMGNSENESIYEKIHNIQREFHTCHRRTGFVINIDCWPRRGMERVLESGEEKEDGPGKIRLCMIR